MTTANLAALSVSQADALTGTQVAAMTVTQTMALNAASANYATPLVLDLDGNGVQTLGLAAGVQFDIRATGKAVGTGWVDGHDGLLALDRNGDGRINDGGELFGSATTLADGSKAQDGYAALAALDSNGDGQITSADSAYGALRVWVDGNSDGVSQTDELKTLEQLGIAAIATRADNAAAIQNGNIVGLTSSYTSIDGSTHASADVWFQTQKQTATSTSWLQQQVSGLSSAIGNFAAAGAAPAAQTQQLTASKPVDAAGIDGNAQVLSSALQQYRTLHGLQAGATVSQRDALPGADHGSNWFSVPNR
jgi:hypothetical protein